MARSHLPHSCQLTPGDEKALAMLKKISPVAWRHIHFQGHFIFTDDKIINLDEIIGKVLLRRLRKNEVTKLCPGK